MRMTGRSWSQNSDYRFGFQGQEQDQEYYGGAVSYKYRIHDPRIGRFLSIDPLSPKYPHNSPYAFSENIVIHGVELEGLEHTFFMVEKFDNEGTTQLRPFTIYEHNAVIHTAIGDFDFNQDSKSHILGSDGSFHTVPEEYENTSVATWGEDVGEIMDLANEWENADALYQGLLTGDNLKSFGENADSGFGIGSLIGVFRKLIPAGAIFSNGGGSGSSWKNKVTGRADFTTPGHAFRSYREAVDLAKRSDVEKIYLDRGLYNTVRDNHGVKLIPGGYKIRPDVAYITKDGKIHIREVMSTGDTRAKLMDRMERAMKGIPESKRGTIDVLEPTKID